MSHHGRRRNVSHRFWTLVFGSFCERQGAGRRRICTKSKRHKPATSVVTFKKTTNHRSVTSPRNRAKMARNRKDVTDAELAVLQVLWACESATIREITDSLYPTGSASDYATVKKLLARIEDKGLVDRDASATAHVFSPAITQDDLIARRLQNVAEDFCDGSHTPLLMNLLKNKKYSAKERKQLHDLVDELFGSEKKKSTKRGSK